MFLAFYSNKDVFRMFKRLKDAKYICGSVGAIKIVSLSSGRTYWLGVDY